MLLRQPSGRETTSEAGSIVEYARSTMWTRDRLVDHLARGGTPQWLFFWGHTPKVATAIDRACLSQWFARAFVVGGATYATAEHWMMAAKARLFDDHAALARVLEAKTPAEAKRVGREVAGYVDAVWDKHRFDVVVEGNVAKFGQHDDLRTFLLATHERILVEASPHDRIWGIGMDSAHPDARNPEKWHGQNLLGFALMEARERLREG